MDNRNKIIAILADYLQTTPQKIEPEHTLSDYDLDETDIEELLLILYDEMGDETNSRAFDSKNALAFLEGTNLVEPSDTINQLIALLGE